MAKGTPMKVKKGKGIAKVPKAKTEAKSTHAPKQETHAMKSALKKKPAKGEHDDPIDGEDIEEEPHEEQAEEEEDEGDETGGKKPSANDWRRFNTQLALAPKHVIEKVSKIKAMTVRSGKRRELTKMVLAFASQKWDHKLFTATEEVSTNNKSAKLQKALPKYMMMAKYGGKDMFLEALNAGEVEEVENPEGGQPLYKVVIFQARLSVCEVKLKLLCPLSMSL